MSADPPTRIDIERALNEYHRRIDDALERKLRARGDDVKTRAHTLAAIRWELVRTLREYQLFKHNRIFDPVIRGGDRSTVALASELKARCVAADEGYRDHVRKWAFEGTATDWSAYEIDLHRTVGTMRAHITMEMTGIRSLLAVGKVSQA